MLFNSFTFAVFLPIVFICYWLIPHRFKWCVVLISSYYFYMCWNPVYIVLILFTTFISYVCALMLEKNKKTLTKKIYIAITLIVSLGILFVFKYFNFFSNTVFKTFNSFGLPVHKITLDILLPVGISFYTFQTLSYVIDVYRGTISAEHHFGKYAAFISFFPQLVAGPIERASNLLPQILENKKFDYANASYGMKLMAWGFFKKIIVADTFSIYVDKVYNSLPTFTGFSLIVATFLFSIQIYCDFSGYSDIAIGTAKLFNINLMTNFSSPYFSSSIKEFWSRWHISLSTWFKDYLYIPLGGNRCSKFRHSLNLFFTFLISGLWHGANWTFIIWGGIHGICQIIERFLLKNKHHYNQKHNFKWWIKILFVFILCNITWIFFRAASFNDVVYIFSNSFKGILNPISYVINGLTSIGLDLFTVENIVIMLCTLFAYDYFSLKLDVIKKISSLNIFLRWYIYITFLLVFLGLLPSVYGGQFIYFQF